MSEYGSEVENVRTEVSDDSSTSRAGTSRTDVNAGWKEGLI